MARFELPVMNTSLRAPAASASSAAYWISGLSTMGSISFGLALVAGRNRVPRPATGKTAVLISCAWVTAHLRRNSQERDDTRKTGRGALLDLLARRALGLAVDFYVGAVALQHLGTDALDLAQLVGAAERAVLLSVCNDRLRSAQADALLFFRDGGGDGRIDVDRSRPAQHGHQGDDEGLNEFGHEALLSVETITGFGDAGCADSGEC